VEDFIIKKEQERIKKTELKKGQKKKNEDQGVGTRQEER
jgi:hypothetical protein